MVKTSVFPHRNTPASTLRHRLFRLVAAVPAGRKLKKNPLQTNSISLLPGPPGLLAPQGLLRRRGKRHLNQGLSRLRSRQFQGPIVASTPLTSPPWEQLRRQQ
jgi:hypothetical protein